MANPLGSDLHKRPSGPDVTPEGRRHIEDALKHKVAAPDLAVKAIRVVPLRKVSGGPPQYNGVVRVRIEVDIKNVGVGDYVSGTNQQFVSLKTSQAPVRHLGGLPFGNLVSGGLLTISFETDWNWHSGEEFPEGLEAFIETDADILLDGNPRNDDRVFGNNRMQLEGADINRIVDGFIRRP